MSDPRYQIDVTIVTRYLPEQSQPEHSRFAFAYDAVSYTHLTLPTIYSV